MNMTFVRQGTAWATVVLFFAFGTALLEMTGQPLILGMEFAWVLAVIIWAAFGVVHEAEEVAEILGAAASTMGLTVPVVLLLGVITAKPVLLGLSAINMVLLCLTLLLNILTFSGKSTTMLEGAVHLIMFFVFLVVVFFP